MNTIICLEGIEFDVEYDYEPAEPISFNDPGSDATVIIQSVKFGEHDFFDLLSDGTLKSVSKKIIYDHENSFNKDS